MVLSDTGSGDIGWRKWFITCWAFVECLLFGGILYGWGSLVFVLKDEGVYLDTCSYEPSQNTSNGTSIASNTLANTTQGVTSAGSHQLSGRGEITPAISVWSITEPPTDGPGAGRAAGRSCTAQDSRFALCFTIGSAVFCASSVFMGHLNYKCGTRVTRITAFCIFIAGSLMLAFASAETPWLIFPGLSVIGIGGLPVLVTNIQVSNLFKKGAPSVVGLLIGGYDMSSAIFLLVKIAYERGFSRQYMYIILAGVHTMTLVSTFCFLPRGFISEQPSNGQQGETGSSSQDKDSGGGIATRDGKDFQDDNPKLKCQESKPTLKSCIKQPVFIIHVSWVCLLQLRLFYFLGTLNPYLTRTLNGDLDLVSYFTDVCFYTMMGGLLSSFFAGIVYDWQKRLFKTGVSAVYRERMPAVFPLAVASLMATLLSVLVIVPGRELLYPIFVVMVLYRSFLYSVATAFLSVIFPSEYFALLYGIMIISAGLFGCLQYAFFTWSEAYLAAPRHTDVCLLCVAAVSFLHPVYLWITARRAERTGSL